jgi:hypothetical protein
MRETKKYCPLTGMKSFIPACILPSQGCEALNLVIILDSKIPKCDFKVAQIDVASVTRIDAECLWIATLRLNILMSIVLST